MKIITILLLLFFINSISAQEIHSFTGPRINFKDESSFNFLELDSLHIFANYYNETKLCIGIFDRITLAQNNEIIVPYPPNRNYKYEKIIIRPDTFIFYYSYTDSISRSSNLGMLKFDIHGKVIGNPEQIDKIDGKSYDNRFTIIYRPRQNEIISYSDKLKKDSAFINIDHFDYSGARMQTQDFIVTKNSGTVYYVTLDDDCSIYNLAKKTIKHQADSWCVNVYSPDLQEPVLIPLTLGSKNGIHLNDFFYSSIDSKNILRIICPYSNNNETAASGIYMIAIDTKNKRRIDESIIPFSSKKILGGDVNFTLSSCIPIGMNYMKDKVIRFIFESRQLTTSSVYFIPVDKEFDIGNIVTVDIDSSNTAIEIHNIKKKQHTGKANYKFTGLAILKSLDKTYFIYNELPGNLSCPVEKMKTVNSAKMDETAIIYTVIDGGKVARKILIDKVNNSAVDAVIPLDCIRTNSEKELFILRKINKDIFITTIYTD
jgi:hypothetical protein